MMHRILIHQTFLLHIQFQIWHYHPSCLVCHYMCHLTLSWVLGTVCERMIDHPRWSYPGQPFTSFLNLWKLLRWLDYVRYISVELRKNSGVGLRSLYISRARNISGSWLIINHMHVRREFSVVPQVDSFNDLTYWQYLSCAYNELAISFIYGFRYGGETVSMNLPTISI